MKHHFSSYCVHCGGIPHSNPMTPEEMERHQLGKARNFAAMAGRAYRGPDADPISSDTPAILVSDTGLVFLGRDCALYLAVYFEHPSRWRVYAVKLDLRAEVYPEDAYPDRVLPCR